MRATVMYEAGDVRIDDVPDATVAESTDALIRVVRTCICGSDLHPYHQLERSETGVRMGHEAIGVVEDVGADVRSVGGGPAPVRAYVEELLPGDGRPRGDQGHGEAVSARETDAPRRRTTRAIAASEAECQEM
jgi:NADPH:quinone reductase-like Zn-dependent oxidoreductase